MFSFFIVCLDKHIEYLLLPSSTSEIFSTARNSFLTILLYASIFPCSCGYLAGIDLSFILFFFRKRLNILDLNCLPLSCITLLGLPFFYNVIFQYMYYIYTSFSFRPFTCCLSRTVILTTDK